MQSHKQSGEILIVGAGFSGAVYARELAEAGHKVRVIDKRSHVAGNCFDEIDACGVRVHRYGPHLFHTSNMKVVHWLSRFTEWEPYEHQVVAQLPDERLAPLPVNMQTVNTVYSKEFTEPHEVEEFLQTIVEPVSEIRTAEDHLYSVIGKQLTDLFFRPYTKKMWRMELGEMSPSIVRRLKIRLDCDARYFLNDSFQAMPKLGYTALFERIFDHKNISVELNCPFDKGAEVDFQHVFAAMPIDEYFDFQYGELPYRSIRFHSTHVPVEESKPHVVINYTDSGPYTRETWWHNIPGHIAQKSDSVLRTIEEPCDYRANNMERYYPVKSYDGKFDRLYEQYKTLADAQESITFIGRCGTYQYLDMHQVVNQSLQGVERWLKT